MVSGEDCTYNDATEYSNVTSLQSDTSCIINTNIPESECVKKENINFEQLNLKDCKCYDVYSQANCGVPPEHCVRPNTVQESPKDLEKNQYTMKQTEPTTPCLCRAHKINAYTLPLKHKNGSCSRPFWCRFKWKWPKKSYLEQKDAMYEVNLRPTKCPHYSEPFIYCEISEGIPNRRKQNYSKVTKPEVKEKEKEKDKQEKMSEKIEIYYFDHGNSAYYRTTDSPPILATERCAEKTDQAATRFWAEIFGTIHIGTAFVTAFILQFLRFILYSIIRPLTVGILQMLADYFIKPCLSIVFNALIQPVLILLYNTATSLKDLCEPIAEAIGLFLREVANVCAAIRIVEVKQGTASSAVCT